MNTQAGDQSASNPQRTLLVVEDNDLDVELLMLYLRRAKITMPVTRAHHGEEALQLLTQAYVTDPGKTQYLVLLDLNMPRMNGFELLERICTEDWYSTLPVFILSTSDQPSDQARATEFQVQGYLQKPISGDLLKLVMQDSSL